MVRFHYRSQRSCGEVMFLHLSVSHSVHRGEACMPWEVRMPGGVHALGGMHAWGACMPRGTCMAREKATAAGTHPTGMHSCYICGLFDEFLSNLKDHFERCKMSPS